LPLYEYACPECGTFERMQKFSDPILTNCPTCDRPVEKLLSAPAIQFKGTGWYITDYAGKGKEKDAKGKDSDSKGEDKKGSDKSGDAKKESSSGKKSTAGGESS
jgi:putative FmdB family regulatory protein